MMHMNKMGILQRQFRTPYGILINEYYWGIPHGDHWGIIRTPVDGQITEDVILMDGVTKLHSERLGLIIPRKIIIPKKPTTQTGKQAR